MLLAGCVYVYSYICNDFKLLTFCACLSVYEIGFKQEMSMQELLDQHHESYKQFSRGRGLLADLLSCTYAH